MAETNETMSIKLLQIRSIKQDIKSALSGQGCNLTNIPFSGYAPIIENFNLKDNFIEISGINEEINGIYPITDNKIFSENEECVYINKNNKKYSIDRQINTQYDFVWNIWYKNNEENKILYYIFLPRSEYPNENSKWLCSGGDPKLQPIVKINFKRNTAYNTATSDKILKNYINYYKGSLITGSIESLSLSTYIPTSSNIIIPSGYYLNNNQIISGDINLRPDNIISGKTIFGISGTYQNLEKAYVISAYYSDPIESEEDPGLLEFNQWFEYFKDSFGQYRQIGKYAYGQPIYKSTKNDNYYLRVVRFRYPKDSINNRYYKWFVIDKTYWDNPPQGIGSQDYGSIEQEAQDNIDIVHLADDERYEFIRDWVVYESRERYAVKQPHKIIFDYLMVFNQNLNPLDYVQHVISQDLNRTNIKIPLLYLTYINTNATISTVMPGTIFYNNRGLLLSGIATNDATATAENILSGYTAYVSGNLINGVIPYKLGQTYIPSITNSIISAGQYLSGDQIIQGDPNLKSENIKNGISIFGISGTLSSGIDVSDTTAEAKDVLLGKTFYDNNGIKQIGAVSSINNIQFTPASANINIPSGCYMNSGNIILGDPNLKPENIISGISIFGINGNASKGKNISDTTATQNKVLYGEKFYKANGTAAFGNILIKNSQIYTPSINNQIIMSGQYLSGEQIILGDTNLIANNIKKNISIFGVVGTYEGSGRFR